MQNKIEEYEKKSAVDYHYGSFPPRHLEYSKLLEKLTHAQDAISRYDQMLLSLPNSELLLGPLKNQEAVISSRMEGTISTVDEIMIYDAESGDEAPSGSVRNDIIEVWLYSYVLKQAEKAALEGNPINENMIKNAHRTLLSYGRGAMKSPGEYKSDQNYVGDDRRKEIYFVPIAPLSLKPAMTELINFINSDELIPFFRVAIAHVEFEALHPFNDGNGRIGRLLITLMLWQYELIHKPYFYISAYFEKHKEEYIERMREVSANNDWTGWVGFFLDAISKQATENLDTAKRISTLYDEMKPIFREISGSKWHVAAQDFIFEKPIFSNSQMIKQSHMPRHTAHRITKLLNENGLIRELVPASGRRGALFIFEPLMEIVRA